ncbi:MAG: hypothetical protein NE330_05540 [Lentisphaeraceae bacterium]|nr:hypothetical protein [Lentisphaeraceae bacterium]
MFLRLSLLLTICLTLASCIGNRQYTPIKYYDFGQHENVETKLNVGSFDIEGPYNERFVYRVSKNGLVKDEYTRWAQAPDLLLSHHLKQSFMPSEDDLNIEGEILKIEHDKVNSLALFKILYTINQDGRVLHKENFQRAFKTNGSNDDYVEKVSKSVKELIEDISQKASNLK